MSSPEPPKNRSARSGKSAAWKARREGRLSDALRNNLRKRKQQKRLRDEGAGAAADVLKKDD